MKLSRLFIEDPRLALFFMIIYSLISGSIVTFIGAILTTLEKRYELSSAQTAALFSANDIGFLISVIFIAYFGSQKNRPPYVLFCSGLGLWLSSMIYAFPFFIYGSKYDIETLLKMNKTEEKGLCLNNLTEILSVNSNFQTGQDVSESQKSFSMFILMIAGILNGVSSTPFWILGMTILEDMAGPEKSGKYLGLLFAFRTFSSIFGFLLGSHVLSIHESLKLTVSQFSAGQRDIKWVGAWWLGWIILGCSALISAPSMILLRPKKNNSCDDNEIKKSSFRKSKSSQDNGTVQLELLNSDSKNNLEKKEKSKKNLIQEILKILKVLRNAFRNKVYATIMIGFFFEFISLLTVFTFFTKYLEYHFRASASMANVMSGVVFSSSFFLGSIASAIISHLFNMSIKNMNRFNAISKSASTLVFIILFCFVCPTEDIRGLDEISKISMCSNRCSCQIKTMEPVCYNTTTFFSPCIAGCTEQINKTFYGNCGCQQSLLAKTGFCKEMCMSIYGFLVVFAITKVLSTISSVHISQVLMRVVQPKYKAVNISIPTVIWAVNMLLFSPLIGRLLDIACVYRNTNNLGVVSHCLLYDNDKMRYVLLGLAFVFQIPACIFYSLAWKWSPSIRNSKIKTELMEKKSKEDIN